MRGLQNILFHAFFRFSGVSDVPIIWVAVSGAICKRLFTAVSVQWNL